MKRALTFLCAAVAVNAATAQIVTEKINSTLTTAKQGSIVILDSFLTEKFTPVNFKKIVMPGPQFLISDDPEYIRVPEAVVLKEKVDPGTVRLYVYNVNGIKEPAKIDRKITALIKNTGKKTMTLQMLRYSSQKPTTNYFLAGKNGLADYFKEQAASAKILIKPGQAVPIDAKLEQYVVKYDELTHGIYEFLIDQPGEVSVLQTDLKSSGVQALARIDTVHRPRGINAGRGKFGVSNYLVKGTDTLNTANGVVALTVADGATDKWIEGRDGATDKLVRNAGNYGVMYNVELDWKADAEHNGLALVTWNARADNKWCGGMANTMLVSGGKFKEGAIQLPADALRTKAAPQAILIQVFTADKAKDIQHIKFTYSPPGASCLPTPLVFVPVKL